MDNTTSEATNPHSTLEMTRAPLYNITNNANRWHFEHQRNEGMTHSQANKDHFLQGEAYHQPRPSHQPRPGRQRVRMSEEQKKENKRRNDKNFRDRQKVKAFEMIAKNENLEKKSEELKEENVRLSTENRHLKEEREMLKAENKKLEGQLLSRPWQLQAEAPQRQGQDTCIAQSTREQLDHPIVSVQVSGSEKNDLQNLHQKISRRGDNTTMEHLMKVIDEDVTSNVRSSDFTGLDGERKKIGKFNFPISLCPVVERIIDIHGDVSAKSKINPDAVEATYILFCASLKEMGDLPLEQITKDIILKWRDAIKDALRINFKVEFAMDHWKKIVHAYIGLLERQKLKNVAKRISKLEADLNAEKEEHAKICVKAIKISKLEADLNSEKEEQFNIYEQSKVYMDAADYFNGKPVSAGMFEGTVIIALDY